MLEEFSLSEVDGNAFSIMGYVINAMKKCKVSAKEIEAYKLDAMSNDYDHLIYVSVAVLVRLNDLRSHGDIGDEFIYDELIY